MNRTLVHIGHLSPWIVVGLLVYSLGFGSKEPAMIYILIDDVAVGVAQADCARQRITVSSEAVLALSHPALADLIAHELAHLDTNCIGHPSQWRSAYIERRGAGY